MALIFCPIICALAALTGDDEVACWYVAIEASSPCRSCGEYAVFGHLANTPRRILSDNGFFV